MDTLIEVAPSRVAEAQELIGSELVIQGSELALSAVGANDRFLLDGFELSAATIDDWAAAGLDVVGIPVFCIGPDAFGGAVEHLARWNSALHDHSDRLVRIGKAADIERARAEGKIGVLLCMHFGGMFRTIDDVDYFYRLGQRSSVIVTHGQNAIGTPPGERYDAGLTHFGAGIVERMNEVGMAVDISHANERTALDAVEISSKPIWANHTCAQAFSPIPKNKSDALMRKIGESGGIIGIQPTAPLVSSKTEVGLAELVQLVEHVRDVAGEEAVALGFEEPYRGFAHLIGAHAPVGPTKWQPKAERNTPAPPRAAPKMHIDAMMRIDRYALLVAALLDRGWKKETLVRFLGGNILRFLQAQEEGRSLDPYESTVRAADINNGFVN